MQTAGFSKSWVFALLCIAAPLHGAGAHDPGDAPIPTRQQLIGAWQLVSIDLQGPNGPIVDPFYQRDSTGIIVYDSSGWMTVEISAPHRQAFAVPESRTASPATGPSSRRKAIAFDTYYAYYGTWNLDDERGVVTHHVTSSLLPAETGASYAQNVTLQNGRLTFTVRGLVAGKETVRRKVWERMTRTQ